MINALHGAFSPLRCFMIIKKKTIYYDNALLKVYDIPIFYFPKLSHPDPSVERRSGFLPAYISDTKNLGSSIYIPYFFAINDDKILL